MAEKLPTGYGQGNAFSSSRVILECQCAALSTLVREPKEKLGQGFDCRDFDSSTSDLVRALSINPPEDGVVRSRSCRRDRVSRRALMKRAQQVQPYSEEGQPK